MRVLGIDPGTICTGYGIIEKNGNNIQLIEYGAIASSNKTLLSERICKIYFSLSGIMKRHIPDCVSIEEIFHCKNVNSAIKLGEARGCAILSSVEAKIPIIEYSAKKVKQSVVGNGNASKEQVAQMVKNLLGLKKIPTPNDASDALAIAICHVHSMNNPLKKQKRV